MGPLKFPWHRKLAALVLGTALCLWLLGEDDGRKWVGMGGGLADAWVGVECKRGRASEGELGGAFSRFRTTGL
ncbi:uncharacterized protein BKA78DRAFT_301541 [Phyllosticta capitalensis]|uniref:uncharacterized protein n=1 Tax=Phyllosticta capitalensis TaxID=121624 RepID=UPI00312E6896